jgi:hypothetical protein
MPLRVSSASSMITCNEVSFFESDALNLAYCSASAVDFARPTLAFFRQFINVVMSSLSSRPNGKPRDRNSRATRLHASYKEHSLRHFTSSMSAQTAVR